MKKKLTKQQYADIADFAVGLECGTDGQLEIDGTCFHIENLDDDNYDARFTKDVEWDPDMFYLAIDAAKTAK